MRKDPISGKALDVTTYRLVVNGVTRKQKFGNRAAALAAFKRAATPKSFTPAGGDDVVLFSHSQRHGDVVVRSRGGCPRNLRPGKPCLCPDCN